MPQGIAVVVGLTRVDPASYNGCSMTSGCWGAEDDVDRIVRLVSPLRFLIMSLKTVNATAEAVLDHLRHAARMTRPGDLFFFYFAGHGRQRPDSGGDEDDGFDELLLAYDRPLADDELDERWREFPEGVRILVISDSCHSGTNFKFPGGWKRALVRPTSAPRPFLPPMKASLIHIGAARDEELASAYRGGGAFTIALCEERPLNFQGGYRDLVRAVSSKLPAQHPRLELYGPGAEEFVREKPFWIGAGSSPLKARRKAERRPVKIK
ncbi:MAG: caspase family protein [Candidatus Aminicenantes bacterium]|nr:caspase family protein [Candidatus Aminicenantes bacterium]